MVAEQSKKLLRKELLEKLLSLTKEEANAAIQMMTENEKSLKEALKEKKKNNKYKKNVDQDW